MLISKRVQMKGSVNVLGVRISYQSAAVIFVMLLMAGAWLVLLLRLCGYDLFAGIRSGKEAGDVGASILSYHASKEEYALAVGGLSYHSIDSKFQMEEPAIEFFKLGDLLSAWNPDEVSPYKWRTSVAHPDRGCGLPRFDFAQPEHVAAAYKLRDAELPFIVYNVPELDAAAQNQFSLPQLLHTKSRRMISTERMPGNKYMYYRYDPEAGPAFLSEWTPPQEDVSMSFTEFLLLVEGAEKQPDRVDSTQPHYYYTISASEGMNTPWIREALPFFSWKPSLFMKGNSEGKVEGFKGVNCRFGMKGIVAANHYDGGRNFVAMIRGRKRYVLLPPSECPHLELYPRGHPSGRHTSVDWSDLEELTSRPDMYNAKATEVVLSMGEMLYIPSNWFHYIISQDASIQCNARSGHSRLAQQEMRKCGF